MAHFISARNYLSNCLLTNYHVSYVCDASHYHGWSKWEQSNQGKPNLQMTKEKVQPESLE